MEPIEIHNLEWFLATLQTAYPEPESALHTNIAGEAMDWFLDRCDVPRPAKVLDIGSGNGTVLDALVERGFRLSDEDGQALLYAVNLLDEHAKVCRRKGYVCRVGDFNHILALYGDHEDGFDLITARHAAEHSWFSDYLLWQVWHLLRKGGYLYIECPAPDTSAGHERNEDHYSIFTLKTWLAKIQRAGFGIIDTANIELELTCGPDTYFAIAAQKP